MAIAAFVLALVNILSLAGLGWWLYRRIDAANLELRDWFEAHNADGAALASRLDALEQPRLQAAAKQDKPKPRPRTMTELRSLAEAVQNEAKQ